MPIYGRYEWDLAISNIVYDSIHISKRFQPYKEDSNISTQLAHFNKISSISMRSHPYQLMVDFLKIIAHLNYVIQITIVISESWMNRLNRYEWLYSW